MSAAPPTVEVPAGVEHDAQTYRHVDGHALRMLSYRPSAPAAAPRPGIIWFHGGGWHSGDPERFAPLCLAAVARGMVAVAPQYRLVHQQTQSVFDCMDDARAACEWTIAHADELGIDPARFVVAGSSAGGHLAATIATHHDDRLAAALVLLNPVLDCTERGYGHKVLNDRGLDASPVHHVRPGLPPTLVVHGDADPTVPYENSVRFDQLMRDAGNDCTLVTIPGGVHGLWSHQRQRMIDETNAFLARHGLIADAG